MKLALWIFALTTTLCRGQGTIGQDYIDEVPATIYEDETISPQNGDFDATNNMFIAHECWYNDYLVHYYKFRIYAPPTYPETIIPGSSTAEDVPIQPIFFVTTTGDMSGVVGNGIIPYHTSDGEMYSDFMEIYFVQAPDGYVENTFKSEGDISSISTTAEINAMKSGIVVNMPIVPTGATLQHPEEGGTTKAPISATPVWYKGNEVWTYVFEVTDQAAADYFADTRENPEDPAFKIPVTAFATSEAVRSIPLRFFNPYSRGVTAGVNGGGPNPAGMRNVINLDRPDPGYSPLWEIIFLTELPINYSANEVSNFEDIVPANGFQEFAAPMFVNCPNIGDVGTEMNVAKETFMTMIDTENETNYILGTHMDLILQNGEIVSFMAGDVEIGTTTTNDAGAYEYALASADIPAGTSEIVVMAKDKEIRTISIKTADKMDDKMDDKMEDEMDDKMDDTFSSANSARLLEGLFFALVACMLTL